MSIRTLSIAAVLTACAIVQTGHAAVTIQASVTPLGANLFRYQFSISNSGPDAVVLVTLNGAPLQDPNIQNSLTAASGFAVNYDAALGVIDFLESSELFAAGSSRAGFRFDSAVAPSAGMFDTFEAISENLSIISGEVQFGAGGSLIFQDHFE